MRPDGETEMNGHRNTVLLVKRAARQGLVARETEVGRTGQRLEVQRRHGSQRTGKKRAAIALFDVGEEQAFKHTLCALASMTTVEHGTQYIILHTKS